MRLVGSVQIFGARANAATGPHKILAAGNSCPFDSARLVLIFFRELLTPKPSGHPRWSIQEQLGLDKILVARQLIRLMAGLARLDLARFNFFTS